ncbi:MAG: beta-N-acetylhexosaminidase [Cellulomonadaceae bacterium]|jgi:hexosaminidase|nr:beta-N-acetylhexosaminidase [Cellulomonadaceae bacterium]
MANVSDSGNVKLGLLPAAEFAQADGGFAVFNDGATIAYPVEFAPAVSRWRRNMADSYGVSFARVGGSTPAGGSASAGGSTSAIAGATMGSGEAADVRFEQADDIAPGGYRIKITEEPALLLVQARDLAGAQHGAQTLRQLAGPAAYRQAQLGFDNELHLPAAVIEDSPRLEWRGVMLDVARRFWTKAELLRYIDLLAGYHINVLQLHLTDDQGWRFEVDAFPVLTEVGSWRSETVVGARTSGVYDGRPHGGFYTRADLREIAAYAKARGIEVIPEVDLPGHSLAAITAYPWLASDKEAPLEVMRTWGISENVIDPSPEALDFYKIVIDQLIEDMDPRFVGIGGDEVPTKNWAKRPDIVQRALDLGFKKPDGSADVKRLGGWFLGELARHITGTGRRAVVWDDAFSADLPADVIVTVWHMDEDKIAERALAAGHDVVLAPYKTLYFDYPQSDLAAEPVHFGTFTTLDDVYAFEPVVSSALVEAPDAAIGAAEAVEVIGAVEAGEAGVVGEAADQGPTTKPGKLLGAQAQLWVEYLNDIAMRDYNMFPRLSAFAEVAWTNGIATDRSSGTAAHADFMQRLEHDELPRLEAAGVAYRPLDGPKPWQQWPGYMTKDKPLYALINMNDFAAE